MTKNELDPVENGFNRISDTRHGRLLHHRHDQPLAQVLEWYGEYAEYQVQLYEQICQPGATVVEVGAHAGEFTLPIAKAVGPTGRVFTYEPEQILFINLCGMLALNSIGNTEPSRAVVSDETGVLMLPIINAALDQPQNMGSFNFTMWESTQSSSAQIISTPLITLDTDLKDLEALHLIKISVNGMEIHVLRGARELIARLRPLLSVASGLPEDKSTDQYKELTETLRSMDYKLYWNITSAFNPDNYRRNTQPAELPPIHKIFAVPSESEITISGMSEITDIQPHPDLA